MTKSHLIAASILSEGYDHNLDICRARTQKHYSKAIFQRSTLSRRPQLLDALSFLENAPSPV